MLTFSMNAPSFQGSIKVDVTMAHCDAIGQGASVPSFFCPLSRGKGIATFGSSRPRLAHEAGAVKGGLHGVGKFSRISANSGNGSGNFIPLSIGFCPNWRCRGALRQEIGFLRMPAVLDSRVGVVTVSTPVTTEGVRPTIGMAARQGSGSRHRSHKWHQSTFKTPTCVNSFAGSPPHHGNNSPERAEKGQCHPGSASLTSDRQRPGFERSLTRCNAPADGTLGVHSQPVKERS